MCDIGLVSADENIANANDPVAEPGYLAAGITGAADTNVYSYPHGRTWRSRTSYDRTVTLWRESTVTVKVLEVVSTATTTLSQPASISSSSTSSTPTAPPKKSFAVLPHLRNPLKPFVDLLRRMFPVGSQHHEALRGERLREEMNDNFDHHGSHGLEKYDQSNRSSILNNISQNLICVPDPTTKCLQLDLQVV
ncbi:hypothetical protein M7I_4664 [Glarea lozoyensis 74030]|uniref:Uncharacterized protein n=1 Tax=Glarea lozoyensis (strain ATCC 74030 / MF5533) TaxID=1104152 RepID=H0EPS7_GLAL7|nr:hypothetical protein M7I_4664 [Glarea lozoyensis 74030]